MTILAIDQMVKAELTLVLIKPFWLNLVTKSKLAGH
jgi:hypothetical protein